MTFVSKTLAVAVALGMSAAASATTLTFDNLSGQYGDGVSIGANMTNDDQTLTYSEGGYVLSLRTTNFPNQGGFGAHIGDATGIDQTYNWHDAGDNQVGAYVTLTRVGGGAFNLSSFDYLSSGLTVTAGNFAALVLSGGGNATPGFNNVKSVSFTSTGYTSNQLDNIVLSAAGVPEPASWALMIGGFGVVGAATRRRRSFAAIA